MPTDIEIELLLPVRDCPKSDRARRVQQLARLLSCSTATIYRKLGQLTHCTDRVRRADAGNSVLSMAELQRISGFLMASENARGQRKPMETALDVLRASGAITSTASASTVWRQLRAHMLHPDQLSLPSQALRLTSKHPNHAWQVDSTTGSYYYLPGGRLSWMEEAEFNKNKPHRLIEASKDLLTRYCVTDHTSHAMKVRYFLGGESTQNLIEFLVWAICRQPHSPMHGVPKILMCDQGPANKSKLFRRFCEQLDIERIPHSPGNARATGSVEKAHDLARMHLETRYKFQDPAKVTLEQLNLDAEAWAAAYCSHKVHSRHGKTRYGCWMEISRFPGALRVPASEAALREAATGCPFEARVDNTKRISYRGVSYFLGLVPGVIAGMKVTVQMNVFRSPAIDVREVDTETGEARWHTVAPEVTNEFGFDGEHVIGEGYKGVSDSVLDTNRKLLKRQAYKVGDGLPTQAEADKARKSHAAAYAGVVDPMADVRATILPQYLPRQAQSFEVAHNKIEAQRFSHYEAAKRIRERTGAAYGVEVFHSISKRFPEGLNEDQIGEVCAELLEAAARAVAGRRAAGAQ